MLPGKYVRMGSFLTLKSFKTRMSDCGITEEMQRTPTLKMKSLKRFSVDVTKKMSRIEIWETWLGVGKRNATEGGKCSHFYSQFKEIFFYWHNNNSSYLESKIVYEKSIIDEYGRNRIFSEKKKKNMWKIIKHIFCLIFDLDLKQKNTETMF